MTATAVSRRACSPTSRRGDRVQIRAGRVTGSLNATGTARATRQLRRLQPHAGMPLWGAHPGGTPAAVAQLAA